MKFSKILALPMMAALSSATVTFNFYSDSGCSNADANAPAQSYVAKEACNGFFGGTNSAKVKVDCLSNKVTYTVYTQSTSCSG